MAAAQRSSEPGSAGLDASIARGAERPGPALPSAIAGPGAGPTDPNIHFDQVTGKWQYEDPQTGVEYEYDESLKRWKRLVDEDELKQQQDAYRVSGVDEERPAAPVQRRMEKKQRKILREGATDPNDILGEATSSSLPTHPEGMRQHRHDEKDEIEAAQRQSSSAASALRAQRERVNSSLFIASLPLDATAEEIATVFSRYGIIAEDDAGAPRVKLYTDASTGMFKGEALLTYFKPESCELAIQLLDATCLRAARGQTKPEMKVQMADWSRKAPESTAAGASVRTVDHGAAGSSSASGSAAKRPHGNDAGVPEGSKVASKEPVSKRPRTEADKRAAAKRYARMNDKLTGWDSDSDEEQSASLRASGVRVGYVHPTARTVVLKRMFTLSELEADPTLLLDLKSDVREECEEIGPVTNVILYDEEPEGVVSVKFKRVEDARECIKRMDGRYFAQRRVEAFLAEGNKVRYRRSGRGADHGADDDDSDGEDDETHRADGDGDSKADKKRKDKFGEWLEGDGNA